LLGKSLRIGDFASAREAWRDLCAHYSAKGFVMAALASLRMRWPTWRANFRRLPPAHAA
jgi:hypothetical protein